MDGIEVLILLFVGGLILWWTWPQRVTEEEGKCRNCGYDLRASRGRCPECGMPFTRAGDHIPLRDDWPADPITPRNPAPDETPTIIHKTEIPWEAQLLRDQLEVRGISAQVQEPERAPDRPYGTLFARRIGSWLVVVWSGDAELATAIRDKLIPPKPEPVS